MAAFGQSEERTIRALAPNGFEDCRKEFLKRYESMHDAYAVPFEGHRLAPGRASFRSGARCHRDGKGARSAAISLKVLGLEQYFTLIKPSSAQAPSKDLAILEVLNEWALCRAKRFISATRPPMCSLHETLAAASHRSVGQAPLRQTCWNRCIQTPLFTQ